MYAHRHLMKFIAFVIIAMSLTACSAQVPSPAQTTAPAPAEKSGETTKTGSISQIGEKYYLQEEGQQPKEVDSYAVDLSAYVGQTVTVTGQYSGDTLFIGSIQ